MKLLTCILHTTCVAAMVGAMFACGGARPDPVAQPPETAEVRDTVRRATIIFGGDVMQHMPQVEAARRDSGYDYSETFRYLQPVFDSADYVILNFETTVSATGRYSGYPMFASPAALAAALSECGVDAVVLANNHTADKGRKGVEATAAALDSAGVRHTGVFADSAAYARNNPLRFEVNGIRFALLNYTYGLNGMPVPQGTIINLIDTTRIAADLALAAADTTDHVIVYFHWGDEYARKPGAAQRELARWCHDRGVEFVIGSHPHVIQPTYIDRDSTGRATHLTVYSLGNLVSNQRKRYTDGGMLLRLDVEHRDSVPPRFDAGYMLAWVYTPVVDGRRSYRIVPVAVADTMLKEGTPERKAYDTFVRDSRTLLMADSTFLEIAPHQPATTSDVQ